MLISVYTQRVSYIAIFRVLLSNPLKDIMWYWNVEPFESFVGDPMIVIHLTL